ncbi:MAG: ORF6N domain-containing protein [Candidatus Omnitrophica bacterium]|nr:ORF6N domain-containing protein [Candidatus Omnitrophota bacterium]
MSGVPVGRPVSPDEISGKIVVLRGKKVMLDSDLAFLYGVPTKRLNEAVRRNVSRFPADFMFQLDLREVESLRSQIATSKEESFDLRFQFGISNRMELLASQVVTLKTDGRGGRRTFPYVFTEQGVAMLSSVLNSKRAIHVNIEIMRAFAKIREMMLSHKELRRKIDEMEQKYDKNFSIVFEALRGLLNPPVKPKREIGFHAV